MNIKQLRKKLCFVKRCDLISDRSIVALSLNVIFELRNNVYNCKPPQIQLMISYQSRISSKDSLQGNFVNAENTRCENKPLFRQLIETQHSLK